MKTKIEEGFEKIKINHHKRKESIEYLVGNKRVSINLAGYLSGFSELISYGKLALFFAEKIKNQEEAIESLIKSKMCLGEISISLMGLNGSEAEVELGEGLIGYTGPRLVQGINEIPKKQSLFDWARKQYEIYENKVIKILENQTIKISEN